VDGLSVAEFDGKLHAALDDLGIGITLRETPFGVPVTTPFPDDREHAAYERDAVERAAGWDREGLASSWCPSPSQLRDLLQHDHVTHAE
jgi:hypothetical protein